MADAPVPGVESVRPAPATSAWGAETCTDRTPDDLEDRPGAHTVGRPRGGRHDQRGQAVLPTGVIVEQRFDPTAAWAANAERRQASA